MATAQVLPKELRLAAPPTMPQARSYLFKQQSQNATYTTGTGASIQINFPRLQRSYLTKDSYLKFRVKISTAAAIAATGSLALDTPGAFGFFDKIEIYDYLGSTLLESTSGIGQLMGTLLDISANPTEMGAHYNITCGTDGSSFWADPTQSAYHTTAATTKTGKFCNNGPASGQQILAGGEQTATVEFAIPIFSFLGTLSNKFVPLHNGFTMVLYFNPKEYALGNNTCSTDGAATIAAGASVLNEHEFSQIYICAQILELGPQAESMLMNSAAGKPLVIPSKSFRNFNTTIAQNSGTFKLDLNLNVASLTNILWIMRDIALTTSSATRYKTLSARTRGRLQSWYFQYGSSILPQTSGIQCSAPTGTTLANGGSDEGYLELMKSRHNLNADTFNSLINRQQFVVDTATAAQNYLHPANTAISGKFAAGLDLELVSGRSQNMICGMNTNGMNTSIYGTFGGAGASSSATDGLRVDCWAEYDSFINISPGIATTVSF